MKTPIIFISKVLWLLLLGISLSAQAQEATTVEQLAYRQNREGLSAQQITISFDKTTHLIFPTAIKYVDLGNASVMAQKPSAVKNILRLKARQKYFKHTNLTVVTADGKFYPFKVSYSDSPSRLTWSFLATRTASFEELDVTEDYLESYGQQIIHEKSKVSRKAKQDQMSFVLKGLFIKDNMMFVHLYLDNHSEINYDIDFIRFYIRDKKVSRRTSVQEIEQIPVHEYNTGSSANHPNTVFGKSSQHKVFTLQKFTLAGDEKLEIEVFERKGGRHMRLQISHKALVKATILSALIGLCLAYPRLTLP